MICFEGQSTFVPIGDWPGSTQGYCPLVLGASWSLTLDISPIIAAATQRRAQGWAHREFWAVHYFAFRAHTPGSLFRSTSRRLAAVGAAQQRVLAGTAGVTQRICAAARTIGMHYSPGAPPLRPSFRLSISSLGPSHRLLPLPPPPSRLATIVCQLRHDPMEQGPTEPHAGRRTFLLSSGGAGGGY